MTLAQALLPLQQAVYHVHTLYLFTKSDLKTIFFPIVSQANVDPGCVSQY